MSVEKSLIDVKAYRRRGDIYRWLRQNYDRVLHDLEVLERSWDSIAADIAQDRVLGARGGKPTNQAARKAWQRVCRDVANAKEQALVRDREKQKRDAYPSRMSRDLRPIRSQLVARPQQSAVGKGSSTVPCESAPINWEERIRPGSPEGQIAKIERMYQWDKRSTWRFGEKEREQHELRIEFDLEYREKWFKKHGSYDWNEE